MEPVAPHGLTDFDQRLRGELTREIAAKGFAPGNDHLAQATGATVAEVEDSLRRLHAAHALLLHPHTCSPWVVHPFALSPGACWVVARGRGWWANCLYCGLGILAAVGEDGEIHTRLGAESEPLVVRVRQGVLQERDLLFHLSVPVRGWWDNVIHACATFLPFRSEPEIDAWCERHRLPRGAVLSLPRLQRFAAEWYGGYVREPWRKRSREDVQALFLRHGLKGDFWRVD